MALSGISGEPDHAAQGGRPAPLPRLHVLLAWALIAAALLILLYRSVKLGGYFPDDAYITFRFAENLYRGLGIVWNEGGPPTEGSTSLLQTLLVAAGFRLGLPVTTTAYIISGTAVAAIVLILWRTATHLTGRFAPDMALPLALYLGGVHFSVHVNSGMDTIAAMALLAASFLAALRLLARPSLARALVVAVIGLLCLWCRPDSAPYLAGQGIVLILAALGEWRSARNPAFLRQLLVAYAALVVTGSAYLAWKYSYFGYILPNSFYVKSADLSELAGLEPVGLFLGRVLTRGLVLVPLLLFVDWKAVFARINGRSATRVALLVLPVICFLLYNVTTTHLVNFNSRFEFPVAAFFWIGAGWLLATGTAFERLLAAVQRISSRGIGFGAATALFLVAFAIPLQLDRRHHGKWFANVQILHYEPVSAALIRAGGGADVTLVYDAAGFIAFDSKVSFLDPVGLCDNTLSGRVPLTPLEREEYLWGRNPDVYLGPFIPASPGAESAAEDPILDTLYAKRVLMNPETFADYGHFMDDMTDSERADSTHYRMRELRDNWISLGEYPYQFGVDTEYTHFIYVRRGSPHADRLIDELGQITTRPLKEIDFNNLLDGQKLLSLEEAERLSAMR